MPLQVSSDYNIVRADGDRGDEPGESGVGDLYGRRMSLSPGHPAVIKR